MKVIDNIEDFIEKIEAAKKTNQLDVSGDEDLSIGIMNLISIEEHLFFSGAKTHDNHFYDMIEDIRECRKELMKKIIKTYKGEVWCISKHLLASCMRLSEVATKLLHSEKKEEAYDLFEKAYNLYCLFWGLNLGSIDEETTKELIKKINVDNINLNSGDDLDNDEMTENDKKPEEPIVQNTNDGKKPKRGFKTVLRDLVSKAINCCRE
ncbi:hypothetical protein FACS1894152_7580 [Bacilli bacterium]|nr:hypothetical protein FACS1894152_7580 [Bacilli bacterium]